MEVAGATSAIKSAVLAYVGTATAGEWFLPSLNERLLRANRGLRTDVRICEPRYTAEAPPKPSLGGIGLLAKCQTARPVFPIWQESS